jgi:hypothetical protein
LLSFDRSSSEACPEPACPELAEGPKGPPPALAARRWLEINVDQNSGQR